MTLKQIEHAYDDEAEALVIRIPIDRVRGLRYRRDPGTAVRSWSGELLGYARESRDDHWELEAYVSDEYGVPMATLVVSKSFFEKVQTAWDRWRAR